MITTTIQMTLPVATIPKAKAIHFFAIIAEWSVTVGIALEIKINQLEQIGTYNLIGINENNLNK